WDCDLQASPRAGRAEPGTTSEAPPSGYLRGRPTANRSGPRRSSRITSRCPAGPSCGKSPRAAGDGGQDRHAVPVRNGCVEPTGESDVLVIDVHVHEAVQAAFLDQPVLEPAVVAVE